MEKENEMKQPVGKKFAVPFFAAMAVLTVLGFLIPLRPTQSYAEKRNLAEFPEFSWEALASGSYFDDITTWFSDTYPGRESWLQVSAAMEAHYGNSDIALNGNLPTPDEIPEIAEKPTEPAETTETTEAAETTEVTEATEPAATDAAETTEATQPPKEIAPPDLPVEQWGGVDAGEDAEIMLSEVIQVGDTCFGYFGFSAYASEEYAGIMNRFAAEVEKDGVRVISALAPSSVGVMVAPEYMEKLMCSDQGKTLEYMHSLMDDRIVKVNMLPHLVENNDEYLYYRTDHHWTAQGAFRGYESICEAAGLEKATLADFDVWDQGDFYGSHYGECRNPGQLLVDRVYAYNPHGNLEMWISDEDGSAFQWPVLTDMSDSSIYSKYMTFIAGDHALTKIVNHDLPEGSTCVIVKDSYGNPMAPLLTQNYHTVYVVDFRKYFSMDLVDFVVKYDVDDVIFVHMLGMAQSSDANGLIDRLVD